VVDVGEVVVIVDEVEALVVAVEGFGMSSRRKSIREWREKRSW